MSSKVLVIDTSMLCCWLSVSGKETCGPNDDLWDHSRVSDLLEQERLQGTTFVLPIATLIETGNHIAKSKTHRYHKAKALAKHLRDAADKSSPWAAFTDQNPLWDRENLLTLAEDWPQLAAGGTSIGDATIKGVAEWYAKGGFHVEILTGDSGLKAYQPAQPPLVPRRRS